MIQQVDLVLSPSDASKSDSYSDYVAKKLKINKSQISFIRLEKRSVDARQRDIKVQLRFVVVIDEPGYSPEKILFNQQIVENAKEVAIVGAGPAGLFAALQLIELGLKPVIFERGKDVYDRKRDIATMYRNNEINAESNYCYGEGGAGTFSDGKLYTRASKRGNVNRILELFYLHGADENILYEAHPHIGSDKLPKVIENIRKRIIEAGGEFHFNTQVKEILIKDGKVDGILLNNDSIFPVSDIILATGHSARDIYRMLFAKNILLESKGFAMGVRIEHPQNIIDNIQYHGFNRGELLPAASYSIVQQVSGRGVYSFCMCPGGFIVPAATAGGEIVVNGMSASKRNSPYANSGFVTEIKDDDLIEFKKFGVLAGLEFQSYFEQMAFYYGGGGIVAPAQRIIDFIQKKTSSDLPETSYTAGVKSSDMHNWIPKIISENLSKALQNYSQRAKGFLTENAIMVGVESRTSSPLRIPRNPETLEHIQIKGLYPCGEGAGYAGGIVSSAMDGMNVALKIANM
ncbi:MAG: NAD(P)/FAD-dependent oxidoreductase [Bacteroidia bacterium]|nr:NAD(P)/FAD-dependent oxidoreductase [Bacteroidia bacterium]